MKSPVVFHPGADEDYQSAFQYYHDRSFKLAQRFELAIASQLDAIGESPEAYPERRAGIRCCVMAAFPYNLYYRMSNSTTQILAIAHQKREPGYYLHRVPKK